MALEKISKVKKITQEVAPKSVAEQPNKDYFESLMNQRRVQTEAGHQAQKEQAKDTEKSLFDEVRELNQKVNFAKRSTPDQLSKQVEDVIAEIDILRNKLETPGLEIKAPVQTILKNKLNHIDENLKVALEKAGVEYAPPERPTSLAKPIDKFLGLLTHSQRQMETLASDVKTMASMKGELSPANMLLIQTKVSFIQQEIELFTSMLNKALESTKTIMNVQV